MKKFLVAAVVTVLAFVSAACHGTWQYQDGIYYQNAQYCAYAYDGLKMPPYNWSPRGSVFTSVFHPSYNCTGGLNSWYANAISAETYLIHEGTGVCSFGPTVYNGTNTSAGYEYNFGPPCGNGTYFASGDHWVSGHYGLNNSPYDGWYWS